MARKTPLSLALTSKQDSVPEASTPQAMAPVSDLTAPKRVNSNKGKYHLGGYYDFDLPEIEAFRILAARTRRSQQDLLLEALRDLLQKHEAESKFGARQHG